VARQVLPIVGAVVGAYFGGAAGAQLGWAIGSVIGNAVDPLVVKGPQIGDLAQQTSQEGVPRPIVFAVSPPMAGNIVACGQPVISTKRTSQGKGGGPVTESQTVHRTYCIAICEGPITAVLRVWKNGSLVYDARPGSTMDNSKFLFQGGFHLGGFDQMPDSDLEGLFGVGNTPAMRGTAYMMKVNEDLTDMRGAVPQYTFQVMRCEGTYLTSRPYAVEAEDAFSADASVTGARTLFSPSPMDPFDADSEMLGGLLRVIVKSYDIPHEDFQADANWTAGTLFVGSKSYDNPHEDFKAGADVTAGTMDTIVVVYDNPHEDFKADANISGGTLS
jgi:hypothetical protein